MIDISVIIPVYNTEIYLKKCLLSVLNQSFRNIEVIIINDGSTDNSLKIINDFMNSDFRVKLINQENQGLGAARNTGIKEAKGEYIIFVDSDDYININSLEILYNQAIKTDADIVIAKYQKILENGEIIYQSPYVSNQISSDYFKNNLLSNISMMVCDKMFKLELFKKNDIFFPINTIYEDVPVSLKLSYFSKRISTLDFCYYNWLERDKSLSRTINQKNIDDIIKIFIIIKSFLTTLNLYEKYKIYFVIGLSKKILIAINNDIDRYANRDYDLKQYLLEELKKSKILEIDLLKKYNFKLYKKYYFNMEGYEMESNENINQLFNNQLNNLLGQVENLKNNYKNIAIYGNGYVGNIIAEKLKNNLVIIFDKSLETTSKYCKVSHPKDLKNYDFDIMIISVLGRESIIKYELLNEYNLNEDKIYEFNLNQNPNINLSISYSEKNNLISLKNKFINKRCFIIGNGPSLNKCDLNLLKDEYTFGVNGIFYKTDEMGFKPTFYMVEDNHVIDDNLTRINDYECQYKFFPSIYKNKIRNRTNTYFFTADLGFYDENHPSFCKPRFSKDFSICAYTGQSVTYMQIQLAYYLGFNEIYLIGMDYNYEVPKSTKIEGNTYESNENDPNHFHPDYFGKGKKWHDPKIERVGWNYEKAKKVLEEEGRIIKNATVGGKLEIFERANYKLLFKD
ncbi:glycosyltransferase [Aliarcobacter skirrowii]|uniref:glycosyltransferase n=1 Tax=Aliarcobacter skirrowii TaxID=28200 RepID=UPI0029BE3191|nr:glycosyltransferase [Aliarcobacter skirrowii]MDX4038443.1 glycosyltransferase [Aliarcobacter skirrowii]